MFKVGKVINYYKGIDVLIIQLSSGLSVGDKIRLYKNGEEILVKKVDKILVNNQNIPFAKSQDVVALSLEDVGEEKEKIQKGSEVYREGTVGT